MERQRLAELAAERERKKQMRREERRKAIRSRLRKLRLYGTPALVCGLLLYVGWQFDWFLPGTPSKLAQLALILTALVFVGLAIED